MAKKIMSKGGGIGESKIFSAPASAPTGVDRILECHINGVPVKELNLDPQVLSVLDYNATDEGMAEKNARPNVREASGIEQGKGPFEKALDQRKDDVKFRDLALFESRDPLKEVADRHAVPGMTPKFLSAQRVKENGGTGIHQVIKNENGDPVMVKGMVLAHAPQEVVEARRKHFQARGNQLLKQIGDQHRGQGGLVDEHNTTSV